MRSISLIVDITNYVMLELNRPNHVFDLSSVQGDLTVRWAKPEEPLTLHFYTGWIGTAIASCLVLGWWTTDLSVSQWAMLLGLGVAGGVMRLTRTMMLEVLRQDYIRTAWAKGLRERSVVLNADELRRIVATWQQEEKLNWSREDLDDVVSYLRAAQYRF